MGDLARPAPRAGDAKVVLKGAATFWFVIATIGQWTFLTYMVVFYGPSLSTGNFAAWNRNQNLLKGYVAGDAAGNLFFAAHVVLAATLSLGGALQLIPRLRANGARFHRWNGRLFMATALAISADGLYLVWVRHASTDLLGAVAITGNAVLIVLFVALAWRAALATRIASHRRWALRCYMVANGQWFFRVGVFGVMLLAKPLLQPFFVAWGFGCYLVPLAALEIYLLVQDGPGRASRLALAAGLAVLAILIGVGTIGAYTKVWRPLLEPPAAVR